MVDRINGFTPEGVFNSPYNFLILTDDTYFYACNAFQVVYGGPDNQGEPPVDGTDATAVIKAALDGLPTNNLGGKTGIIQFSPGVYPITEDLEIPDYSQITLKGQCWESPYEILWGAPALDPDAFNSAVVFDFQQAGTCIKTTLQDAPPSGQSGLTVFLDVENLMIQVSTSDAVTAIDASGMYSGVFRNVCAYYNLANKNWFSATPVTGSIGFTSPNPLNERIVMSNVIIFGFDSGFIFGCDHLNATALEAAYCQYALTWVAAGGVNNIKYFHSLRCRYGVYYNDYEPEATFNELDIEYNGNMPWVDGYSFKFSGGRNGQKTIILSLIDSNGMGFLRYEAGVSSYLNILMDHTKEVCHLSGKMALGQSTDGHATDGTILWMKGLGSDFSTLGIDSADAMLLAAIGTIEFRTNCGVSAKRVAIGNEGAIYIKSEGTDFATISVDESDNFTFYSVGNIRFKTDEDTDEYELYDGDFYAKTKSKGLRVVTPDGSKVYRIRVDNSGNVVSELT
jgi:hypothetical protein